jgi:Cu-Zn family superoxide dismutase
MPNVTADAYGNATVSGESSLLSVGGGEGDVIGKGLIVHRDPDDYKSQPAGNAGPRLACAVIRKG